MNSFQRFLKPFILIGLGLVISQSGFAQNKKLPVAPHGGKLQAAQENYFIEFVFSRDSSLVYLLDKKLKPTNNAGITGEISFEQPDSVITRSELKPAGPNCFVAKTTAEKYTAVFVRFDIKGTKISARFEEISVVTGQK